jgi:hypothetical protein
MIQIEKITKIGNRFEAIANDGTDYGSEISATILLRAAEAWNNKTRLYFNTETNKWTRVAEFPEPKVAKAPKAPKAVKAKNPAKGAALKAAAKKAEVKVTVADVNGIDVYAVGETPGEPGLRQLSYVAETK